MLYGFLPVAVVGISRVSTCLFTTVCFEPCPGLLTGTGHAPASAVVSVASDFRWTAQVNKVQRMRYQFCYSRGIHHAAIVTIGAKDMPDYRCGSAVALTPCPAPFIMRLFNI